MCYTTKYRRIKYRKITSKNFYFLPAWQWFTQFSAMLRNIGGMLGDNGNIGKYGKCWDKYHTKKVLWLFLKLFLLDYYPHNVFMKLPQISEIFQTLELTI